MLKFVRTAVIITSLLTLSGCGFVDYFLLPPPEDTAQELYEAGLEYMKEKDYSNAAEYFQKLKDKYPFSPYTPQAELALGDAWFLDEEYELAVDSYQEFEALHPRHEMIEYVIYQIGVSNFKLFKSIDLPQARVVEAMEYFRRLVDTYPESKYADQAVAYISECRRLQAEHEVFVADFYWRSENYGAAWERYSYIVANFQDRPKIVAYSEKRAKLAWMKHQKTLSQEERERIQGSWKQWFDWL